MFLSYVISSAPPVDVGELDTGETDPALVTQLLVHPYTQGGQLASPWLAALTTGSQLALMLSAELASSWPAVLSGNPSLVSGLWQLPVAMSGNPALIPTGQLIHLSLPETTQVVADLQTLRLLLGARTTEDDQLLSWALSSAQSWMDDHCYPEGIASSEVQYATLLQASRWYKRRQSPEGVAGFSDFGAVRITAIDVDIKLMIEHHLNMRTVGIA